MSQKPHVTLKQRRIEFSFIVSIIIAVLGGVTRLIAPVPAVAEIGIALLACGLLLFVAAFNQWMA